jgi:hypothetical protein
MARKPITEHLKKHLKERGVDPDSLADGVYDTLNSLSADEVQALDRVGTSLEAAKTPLQQYPMVIH